MGSFTYFALWLGAVLVAAAFASAAIARHLRLRELRRQQAAALLEALARYSDWFASLRRATAFTGESPEAAEALDAACSIRSGWFPELAGDMAELLAVHNRMVNFLQAQDMLRQRDAEAWLESDHDGRFLAMWRQHVFAVQALHQKLNQLGTAAPLPSAGQSRYA